MWSSQETEATENPNTMVLLLLLITGLCLRGMKVRRDELALINDLQNRICCRKVLNITMKSGDSMQMWLRRWGSEGKCWNMGALRVSVTEFCNDVISCTYQSQRQAFRKQDIWYGSSALLMKGPGKNNSWLSCWAAIPYILHPPQPLNSTITIINNLKVCVAG